MSDETRNWNVEKQRNGDFARRITDPEQAIPNKSPICLSNSAAALGGSPVRVWVLVLVHGAPDGGYEVVLCLAAVADQTSSSLADPHPRPLEILLQPLVVLREPAELELGHALLVRAVVHC